MLNNGDAITSPWSTGAQSSSGDFQLMSYLIVDLSADAFS